VILPVTGDDDESIYSSLFKLLEMRRIYFINMNLDFNWLTPSNILTNYLNQFGYSHHVFIRGDIIDDIAMFIISHSPCLQSIGFSQYDYNTSEFTDDTLQSIAQHCTGSQSFIVE